ncbi:MAG: DUF2017 family protein [Acidimicrobiia bacterium]
MPGVGAVMRRRVRRGREGMFQVRLPDIERDLLLSLVGQLRELLVAGEPDGLERLFPPGYANDEERNREWSAITHDELLDKRLASLDLVEKTASAREVDEAGLTAWMAAVNDLRLVLGTRLGITEDDDGLAELGAEDAGGAAPAVYAYLTQLLGEIVYALANW